MIYLSLFIILWSYYIYIFKHFLLLVSYNHQESAIMLSFKVWSSFVWIKINMWIHVNIIYFEILQHRVGLSTSYNISIGGWTQLMTTLMTKHNYCGDQILISHWDRSICSQRETRTSLIGWWCAQSCSIRWSWSSRVFIVPSRVILHVV
jgi:hypothetical protein